MILKSINLVTSLSFFLKLTQQKREKVAGDFTQPKRNTSLHVLLSYQVKLNGSRWFSERKKG